MIATLLSLGAAELYADTQKLPRIQSVRDSSTPGFSVYNGVPLWEMDAKGVLQRQNRECVESTPDGRADVLLLGDSIFHGVRLLPEESLGAQLSVRLEETLRRPPCIVNLAEPGYSFQNEKAVAERYMAEIKPRIVLLEIWGNTSHKYRVFGDRAYNFGSLETDERGLPPVKWISSGINEWLFSRSALWRQISIRTAKRAPGRMADVWRDMLRTEMEPFYRWVQEQDAILMLAYPTNLAAPFSEPRKGELSLYPVVQTWAEENNLATMYFQEVFKEEDYKEVRLDPCCHLNAVGTSKLADAMAPWLGAVLRPENPVD